MGLFPRRLKNIFSFLQNAGTEDVTDEDEKRRIILVNTISMAICALLILITPVFYALSDKPDIIIYPVILDFIITFSVILLNLKKKYLAASFTVYVIQCASIMYFGILLSNVVALEAMIIFLITIIYLIFKEERYRRICLAIAIGTLAMMETSYYFNLFPPIPLSYNTTFIMHALVISGILVLIIIVSKPYIKSNDTNKALKLANHFKKVFVHQVTHEIRTPLNAIYGVAQLLKRQIMLNDQFRSLETLVDQQLDAINNTRSIINNVLDMAQIESGVISKSEKEHFLLKPFFYKIAEVNKVMGRTRNIRIKLSIEKMPDVLYDDILNLHQVSTNLLANALKYADRNSVVELRITGMGSKWSLQVINQGPVITPEKQELIFNPFVTDKSKYIEGTGLGLYIVSGKVKSMGGDISLSSDAAGTVFTVSLPLMEGNMELIKEEKDEEEMWDDLGHINVVLAEDNELSAQLLSRMLTQIGCNTTWVKNGLELIQQVGKHIPDIIIMDYHMEVMDGEQTLYHLKQVPAYKNIPVIISTGDAYAETRDAFLKAGADAFIEKPINYSSLIKVLKMHLHHNSQELLE
ncbi:Signal transduction histidine kinase [Chitinophaga niabensis]|uniref:histidine kinase n=2 Tax=Chitinophaga niabensis TaxID=536979 RepID=A0A1N6K390_9BACT|nr:Signal transduction histidine kinase [Chitinophaga niabensis]